jgi:hypothetical protein
MPDQYVWLVWSSAFLVPWLVAYVAFPRHRKAMMWASLITAPLGLTEPLFVPDYWNPPSLFDLARRSGFDIESVIFSFAIGGIGAVLYNLLTGRALLPISAPDRHSPHHKMHYWALATPFLSFPLLYLFRWNPIYPAIVAMTPGAAATYSVVPTWSARHGWAHCCSCFCSVSNGRHRVTLHASGIGTLFQA